ncbi:TCP domain-containing protein [Cephalotus follicularis]|uniref:TCP domain-containing protein n=1 Tax=Cephalotus follicularis TaxID=3775 RepID=A0A1Q3CB77_CEPFO|nr:TCP domain-containing protein [Cephalotus follicularis]
MFTSSTSSSNPFPFPNQIILESSFTGNENPSSTHQDHPSPFLNFPASFLDSDDNDGLIMSHFLQQQQQQQQEPQILGSSSNVAAGETQIKNAPRKRVTKITTKKKSSTVAEEAIPRKRTRSKDRHSKIHTAQGPRDRRMRLSLQIARKFFDLQDILGFDKASKTIEWLLSKSKAAIKELTVNFPVANYRCSGGGKSVSYTSESEVVSGVKEIEDTTGDQKGTTATGEPSMGVPMSTETKKWKSRKTVCNPVARASRDKARERARKRTKEKMKMKGFQSTKQCCNEVNPNEFETLGSSSFLDTGENLGQTFNNSSQKVVVGSEEEEHCPDLLLEHQMDSISTVVEKFLGIARSPISSSNFSYSQNFGASKGASSQEIYPAFTGNWDINNNDRAHYSYCAMTNKKPLTVNAQAHNRGAIFMTQEQNPSPVFMTNSNPQELTQSSVFSDSSNVQQQNSSSILMTNSNFGLQSHFVENQFSCNPIFANKYGSLY